MQLGGSGGQLPQWATSLIIFGSCVLVTTLVLAAGRIVHYVADRHAGKYGYLAWSSFESLLNNIATNMPQSEDECIVVWTHKQDCFPKHNKLVAMLFSK